MTSSLPQQLTDLLGPNALLPPGQYSPEHYAVDGVVPQAVVQPADRESIARLLRWAAHRQVSVFPRGGGVLNALGNVPARVDVVMDLSRYNRVLDYQPADLTATVEPGVTLQTLRRELAQGDKFVPLEAPLAERATIGGILAANVSGPLRYSYGLPRDWLIGISVVGADGVESKAGGKVVKNVTGYDLNKLYTGSLGTLGVIVEATFKLAPRPDAGAALVASFPSVESGIDAGRSLIAQVYAPQGLQVVNRSAARQLGLDAAPGDGVVVLVFIAGRPRAVARRLEESARLLRESGASGVDSLDDTASQSLLRQLTDLGWSDATTPYLGLKVNLPPDRVSKLVAALATTEDSGIVADPGFGAVQLLRWPEKTANDAGPSAGLDNAAASGIVDEIDEIDRIRQAARNLGGTVVVEHCPPSVKAQIDVWGKPAANSESGAELEIMRRIKQNFDPSGILNPGRFIGKL